MPGSGRAPKAPDIRRNTTAPSRGEWRPAAGIGWQHGGTPEAPEGLTSAALEAWSVWMGSWIAAHWLPTDLPGLRHLIMLYDDVERGMFARAGECRIQMDTYGLTPKGLQDRRWAPPAAAGGTAKVSPIKLRRLAAS